MPSDSPTVIRESDEGPTVLCREKAHGIRAVNKLVHARPPIALGGAEAAALWSVGDDGCVRAWRCDAASFEERTPLNGTAMAL